MENKICKKNSILESLTGFRRLKVKDLLRKLWFMMPWALAIYITDTKTFAILHWHSKLAKRL